MASAIVALEVADYCDEQKELTIDQNLLYGTEEEFNFKKCSDEAAEDLGKILSELTNFGDRESVNNN